MENDTKKNKINATIANFTCTFNVDKKHLPLLDYFKSIVYPAFNDKKLFKETKSGNKYYISDLKLVKLTDDIIALTGKHIKKTILDISQDYDPNNGFKGKDSSAPSAPYSSFILTLNNHRLIYYKNKKGAPTIKNFEGTCKSILIQFIEKKQKDLINTFKDNNYIHNGIKYNYIDTFRAKVVEKIYPQPELSIIPIESKSLVESKFNEIETIQQVVFTFKPTNNEPINFNSIFESNHKLREETESNSTKQIFNSPKNKEIFKNAILISDGKTDYILKAKAKNNDPIKLIPGCVSEDFPIEINTTQDVDKIASDVYNQLKDKEALKTESKENRNLYNIMKGYLFQLIERR